MHFFVEHNKGHHKRVATHEDPSSARLNESLFEFYFRTIPGVYFSAWEIESKELKKKDRKFFSIHKWASSFTIDRLLMRGMSYLVGYSICTYRGTYS